MYACVCVHLDAEIKSRWKSAKRNDIDSFLAFRNCLKVKKLALGFTEKKSKRKEKKRKCYPCLAIKVIPPFLLTTPSPFI